MEPLEQHARAMEEFDRRIRAIADHQWRLPTPCTDWDVYDLVDHLVTEQLWAPHMLAGATLDDVGNRFDGNVLGDDPVATWEASARAARAAFTEPGALERTVDTTMGETPALEYTRQMTLDLAIHAWDLARAIGADEHLDPALVAALHEIWEPRAGMLADSGVFAAPVDVGDEADTQVRLLAVLGRDGR